MVDYSCALKLTGSVAVMTAMSDAAKMGVMVKGAKYFESFAKADTIVFDKTGTLTEAQPRLACVLTTDGWSEDEVLRLSACLEEHFPHPVARAVVNAAHERGLEHREPSRCCRVYCGARHRFVHRGTSRHHRLGTLCV